MKPWMAIVIVLFTAALMKAEQLIEGRKQRQVQAYTVMTMMSDLAFLASKCGYKSWIDYLKEAYGEENSTLYLTQVYNVLYRSHIKGEQIDELKAVLKEYLKSVPAVKGAEQESTTGKLLNILGGPRPDDTELPPGLRFMPKKKK